MIKEKTAEWCIYSRLGGNPELADLLCLFVEEIPARVAKLLRHLDEGNWEELRQTAHQLKGTAGSYGFELLPPSANRVECAVRDNEPEEQIRESVLELVNLCGRVRCGVPE